MTNDEFARQVVWAGETFNLTLDQPWVRDVLAYRGLPGQFGDTPAACLMRFANTLYSSDDVERVLELGLVGGGKTIDEAEKLIEQHVRRAPIGPNAQIAFNLINALFVGKGAKQ